METFGKILLPEFCMGALCLHMWVAVWLFDTSLLLIFEKMILAGDKNDVSSREKPL